MGRIQLRFYARPADAKMARDGLAAAVHQILILPKVKVLILIFVVADFTRSENSDPDFTKS